MGWEFAYRYIFKTGIIAQTDFIYLPDRAKMIPN